jgi:hypothetical protein
VILLLLTVTLYPTALVIWISFQKTRYYALEGFTAGAVDAVHGRCRGVLAMILNPSYGLLRHLI